MTPEEAGRLHAAANRRWGRVLTDHEIAEVYKTWLAREQPSGLLRRFTAAFRAEEARLRGEDPLAGRVQQQGADCGHGITAPDARA